jgi:hypothetical protein
MEAYHLFLVADWLSAIQCQDTPYQDIAAIVEFMYRGEINVSQVSFRTISTVQYSISTVLQTLSLKGLSYKIDFENVDEN